MLCQRKEERRLRPSQTHLVHRQVQGPEAEEDQAVPQRLQQRGCQAQSGPSETQQLHGRLGVQAQMGSQPQQGGRGQQLFQERLPSVPQLPAGREQPIIPIQTWIQGMLISLGLTFLLSMSMCADFAFEFDISNSIHATETCRSAIELKLHYGIWNINRESGGTFWNFSYMLQS